MEHGARRARHQRGICGVQWGAKHRSIEGEKHGGHEAHGRHHKSALQFCTRERGTSTRDKGTRDEESEVRTYAADSQLGGPTGSCSWIAATVDATATATVVVERRGTLRRAWRRVLGR